jgi:hypothetical protein
MVVGSGLFASGHHVDKGNVESRSPGHGALKIWSDFG